MEIHIRELIWTRVTVKDDVSKEDLIQAIKDNRIWDDDIFDESEQLSDEPINIGYVQEDATIELWFDDSCERLLYDNKSGIVKPKEHEPKKLEFKNT